MGSQNSSQINATETIGILGGGQLAQMLCQSARSKGIATVLYAQQPHEPAVKWASKVFLAPWDDIDELARFFSHCTHVIFESEFVPLAPLRLALEKFSKERGHNVAFFPPLQAIEVAQDKLAQKKMFQSLGLPASAFTETSREQSSNRNHWIKLLNNPVHWSQGQTLRELGVVIKWSRLGYDGKGTFIIAPKSFVDTQLDSILDFCERGFELGASIYVEEYIPFIKELALVGTSRHDGVHFFPLIETIQKGGICRWTRGPIGNSNSTINLSQKSFGEEPVRKAFQQERTSEDEQNRANSPLQEHDRGEKRGGALQPSAVDGTSGIIAKWQPQTHQHWNTIAQHLHYLGTMAIEYFLCPKGNLFINELAPRVHNSGHITQDAFATSQFDDNIGAVVSTWNAETMSASHFGERQKKSSEISVGNNKVHVSRWPHWAMYNLIGRTGQLESKLIRSASIIGDMMVAPSERGFNHRPIPREIDSKHWNEQFLERELLSKALKQTHFIGDAHLHWYDKATFGAGRKMGHINLVSINPIDDTILEQLDRALSAIW